MAVAEVERLRAELAVAQRLAQVDSLTQVWNRRAIVDLLRREIDRSRRERMRVGVVFVDLDNFKSINDVHGHAAGDVVLCEAVARMCTVVRPYDHIGRWGGDELVVIVVGSGAESGALRVARQISEALRSHPVTTAAGAVSVTASIGVVVGGRDASNVERLIADADRAMYKAKRAGGDGVYSTHDGSER